MARIRLIDEGVVYRNTNPGYEFHFACHSYLVQLTSKELLCTFQRGQALYSVDSVMVQARSSDGGRSWQTEGLIHDASGPIRPNRCSTSRPAAFSRPTLSSTIPAMEGPTGRGRRSCRFPRAW